MTIQITPVKFKPTLDALLDHIASNIHLDPTKDAASALYRLGYSWYHCERRTVPRTKKVAGYVFYMTTPCDISILPCSNAVWLSAKELLIETKEQQKRNTQS